MKKTYETWCPLFPGFYGTVFECSQEENEIHNYNQENKTDLDWDDFNWDHSDYHHRVSKAFVNRCEREINDFLPVKMSFETLQSPKEYNFANDSINVEVEVDLDELLKLVKSKGEEAAKYLKGKYTSCSGFISFHSPRLEMWLDKEYILEKPAHRIGALLDCLCTIEIDIDNIYYWCDSEYYISFEPKEKEEV